MGGGGNVCVDTLLVGRAADVSGAVAPAENMLHPPNLQRLLTRWSGCASNVPWALCSTTGTAALRVDVFTPPPPRPPCKAQNHIIPVSFR